MYVSQTNTGTRTSYSNRSRKLQNSYVLHCKSVTNTDIQCTYVPSLMLMGLSLEVPALTYESNTSSQHKQSIQCTNLYILLCLLTVREGMQHTPHNQCTRNTLGTLVQGSEWRQLARPLSQARDITNCLTLKMLHCV